MKTKLFLFATALLLGSSAAMAQQQRTVSGIVTDTKGVPIPGAKVELVGCNESVLTELDGTFLINTECPAKKVLVQYGGMQKKSASIKPDMKVKLHKSGWWSDKPERYRWFASAQVAFPYKGFKQPAFGLMVGVVKDWGVYARGFYKSVHSVSDNDTYWYTGDKAHEFASVSGGIIKRLWCPIHVYVGAGFLWNQDLYKGSDGEWHDCYYDEDFYYKYSNVLVEGGLMLTYKMLTVNAGVMWGPAEVDDSDIYYQRDPKRPFAVNIGIGISF
ncbi:MAG: carboxypeptidase-like regulatory domain-containing protein [Bacteroidales bacterium]|nr:carboxypeptidase-like regulatory domain-containing protein [Bacteroidales bacterium]